MMIIDFDDTLFDTTRFLKARRQALSAVGVPHEVFEQTYRAARTTPEGLYQYSDERHAAMLGEAGFDETQMLSAIQSVSAQISTFVFPDTEDFLKELKAHDPALVLLSLGDPMFQELKVKDSGVASYFERLFMINDSKAHVLKELLGHTHNQLVWFINDKPDETIQLYAEFPTLLPVLKVSPRIPLEQYEASGLPFQGRLLDIAMYVTSRS